MWHQLNKINLWNMWYFHTFIDHVIYIYNKMNNSNIYFKNMRKITIIRLDNFKGQGVATNYKLIMCLLWEVFRDRWTYCIRKVPELPTEINICISFLQLKCPSNFISLFFQVGLITDNVPAMGRLSRSVDWLHRESHRTADSK